MSEVSVGTEAHSPAVGDNLTFIYTCNGCRLSPDVNHACTWYTGTEDGTVSLLLDCKLLETESVQKKKSHLTQVVLFNVIWHHKDDGERLASVEPIV